MATITRQRHKCFAVNIYKLAKLTATQLRMATGMHTPHTPLINILTTIKFVTALNLK